MKRSELKTGYRLTFKDGHEGIVLLNTSKGDIVSHTKDMNKGKWFALKNLPNDLYEEQSTYCVVKVDDAESNYDMLKNYTKIIWEYAEKRTCNSWYRSELGSLIYFTEETVVWGINYEGKWNSKSTWGSLNSSNWIPVTQDEAIERLKAFLSEIYPIGTKIRYEGYIGEVVGEPYFAEGSQCMSISTKNTDRGNSNFPLINTETGELTEIVRVPEYTWDELKEKLGHEFTIKNK